MSDPFIFLSPEITRAHALTLKDWLADEAVTRYLSDSRHVSRSIAQMASATTGAASWAPARSVKA